jgi:hypothetical protein
MHTWSPDWKRVLLIVTWLAGAQFSLALGVKLADPVGNAQHLVEYTFDLSSSDANPKAAVREMSAETGDFPQVPWTLIGTSVAKGRHLCSERLAVFWFSFLEVQVGLAVFWFSVLEVQFGLTVTSTCLG